MILVRLLIDLMAFSIPTERIITNNDILCNEKGVHSKIVKVVYCSSRVTITFFTCGFSFTVQHTNVSWVITAQNSPLHSASCRLKPSIDGVRVRCSTEWAIHPKSIHRVSAHFCILFITTKQSHFT